MGVSLLGALADKWLEVKDGRSLLGGVWLAEMVDMSLQEGMKLGLLVELQHSRAP